jgi:hypothetical protein
LYYIENIYTVDIINPTSNDMGLLSTT